MDGDRYYNILHETCQDQFRRIVLNVQPESPFSWPIVIDFTKVLLTNYNEVATQLLDTPEYVLQKLNKAAQKVLLDVRTREAIHHQHNISNRQRFNEMMLNVRICSLPTHSPFVYEVFPDSTMTGNFLCLIGTVRRVTDNKVVNIVKRHMCSVCKGTMDIEYPASRGHMYPKDVPCPMGCVKSKFVPVGPTTGHKNYQEIKLHERLETVKFGGVPKTMTVVLRDDLVNCCNVGDDVSITGYLYLRFNVLRKGHRIEPDLVLHANHVEIKTGQPSSVMTNEESLKLFKEFWKAFELNPFGGRNFIVSSFCPQLHGMFVIKLAMCVTLAGGTSYQKADGCTVRGDAHILLVGDPGTGKSQLLKFASKACVKSLMTTGYGTSAAGLTASAVQENNEWHLEAGALMLAHGGVCCIDEFSHMNHDVQDNLHQVMESQCITITKACSSMTGPIPTRVTIVAATNPKGKYNPDDSSSVVVDISPSLLSRFDLVLIMLDTQNDEWDSLLANFILGHKDSLTSSNAWDITTFRDYMATIKKQFSPLVQGDPLKIIDEYYAFQRRQTNVDQGRTTIRLYYSLRRLSEGHAKLMFRNTVLVCDAIVAILLTEHSHHTHGILRIGNSVHTMTPVDPVGDYEIQAKMVLEKLKLDDIWKKEKTFIDNLKKL